jgi:hypothetical protein
MALDPGFGSPAVIPDDAVAAWGARLIVTQGGDVDFVGDRQGADGPQEAKDRLFQVLNATLDPARLRNLLADMLAEGWMSTREREDFILHMDDELVVHANTNASAGYCYVTAWLPARREMRVHTVEDFTVGQEVWVVADQGQRRGEVTKLGRTRVTVRHARNQAGDMVERPYSMGAIIIGQGEVRGGWALVLADGHTRTFGGLYRLSPHPALPVVARSTDD